MTPEERMGRDFVEALKVFLPDGEADVCEAAKVLLKEHMRNRALKMIEQRYRDMGGEGAAKLLAGIQAYEDSLVTEALKASKAKAKAKTKTLAKKKEA